MILVLSVFCIFALSLIAIEVLYRRECRKDRASASERLIRHACEQILDERTGNESECPGADALRQGHPSAFQIKSGSSAHAGICSRCGRSLPAQTEKRDGYREGIGRILIAKE